MIYHLIRRSYVLIYFCLGKEDLEATLQEFRAQLSDSQSTAPVPSIPGQFQDDETDLLKSSEGVSVQVQQLEVVPSSPPPLVSPSNRASVDGMDPVYANVLRRSVSYSSLLSSSSPFRQSVLIRSSRGGAPTRHSRGGAAFQEVCLASLQVGQPVVVVDGRCDGWYVHSPFLTELSDVGVPSSTAPQVIFEHCKSVERVQDV